MQSATTAYAVALPNITEILIGNVGLSVSWPTTVRGIKLVCETNAGIHALALAAKTPSALSSTTSQFARVCPDFSATPF